MKTEFSGSRRTFIKCAAIFGSLAALFGRGKRVNAEAKEPMRKPGNPSQGYRVTDHVKRYYETARL